MLVHKPRCSTNPSSPILFTQGSTEALTKDEQDLLRYRARVQALNFFVHQWKDYDGPANKDVTDHNCCFISLSFSLF